MSSMPNRTIGRAVGLVAIATIGCRAEYPHARVGLRLATAATAKQYSARTQHIDLPFQLSGNGVNGTALVFDYLQRLEAAGAIYVSDLAYAIQVRHNGTPIECVSKIVLRGAEPAPAAGSGSDAIDDAAGEYSTTVVPFRPDATDTWVIDRELACKRHATQVVSEGTKYDTVYDVTVGGHLEVNPKEIKTDIVYYDACELGPAVRRVHRYEHFVAARFNPPDVRMIGHRYADLELVEEPPLCHEIVVKPGQPLRQHITSDAYWPSESSIQPVENPVIRDYIMPGPTAANGPAS
jgi:hypothetical protein